MVFERVLILSYLPYYNNLKSLYKVQNLQDRNIF